MNKYTVGGVILGIFLLAAAGIRSAVNWPSSSTPRAETRDEDIFSDDARTRSNGDSASAGSDADRPSRQPDGLLNDPIDRDIDTGLEQALETSPLAKAGTYIQRQKSTEDELVAGTPQEVIETVGDNRTPSSGDSRVPDQPEFPELPHNDSFDNDDFDAARGPETPAPPPAVPALW